MIRPPPLQRDVTRAIKVRLVSLPGQNGTLAKRDMGNICWRQKGATRPRRNDHEDIPLFASVDPGIEQFRASKAGGDKTKFYAQTTNELGGGGCEGGGGGSVEQHKALGGEGA